MMSLGVIASVWEGLTRTGIVPRYFLPPLDEVGAECWRLLVVDHTLYGDIGISIVRILAGFGLAVAFGVLGGIIAGLSQGAEQFLVPSIAVSAPLPKVAFLPLFVIWFGLGETAKILVVFINNFYQPFINTFAGVKGVDRRYIWSAQSMGLSHYAIVRDAIIPGSLPYIIAGVRMIAPVSVVIIVLAEMVAARNGIGFYTYQMARDYRLTEMFVGLSVLAVIAVAFDLAVGLIGRRLLHWEGDRG
jgi:NitT/TauT family transport system permease protein